MRSFIFLIALFAFSCLAATENQPVDVIAIDYPPYTSPKLVDNGSNFSLLNKYAQSNLRVLMSPLFVPPARANLLMKGDNWCLSFYPPPPENKLARFVPLSAETVRLGFYRLTQTDSFRWEHLTELSGKLVALLRPNSLGQMHKELIDAGLQLVFVESIEQGLELVLKERVDYAFGDDLVVSESRLNEAQKQRLQFSESSLHEAKIGFFYNIQCKEMLFNSAE